MMKKQFRVETRKSVEEEGDRFDEATFNRAYAKAKRWADAAYGGEDMESYANEVGCDISLYYYESIETHHNDTFNREAFTGGSAK